MTLPFFRFIPMSYPFSGNNEFERIARTHTTLWHRNSRKNNVHCPNNGYAMQLI